METQTQAPTQPTQNAPQTTQPVSGESTATAQSGKTFTQEQLDAILADRLARERNKYADYETLKAKAQEAEDAKKSEIEKAAERASKAESKLKEVEQAAKLAELRASAKEKAIDIGFDNKRLDKVMRLVEVTADTTPEQLQNSLESLAKEMPELLAKSKTPNVGATNPGKDTNPNSDETKRIVDAAMRRGDTGSWFANGRLIINDK